MFKKLLKNYPSLFIYLLVNLTLFGFIASSPLSQLLTAQTLKCDARGFGSGVQKVCSASEFLWENLFWVGLGMLIFQYMLIPAALITHFLGKIVVEKIKKSYKERLWFKYSLAIFIYVVSALFIGIII